jgi:hypothetical protein
MPVLLKRATEIDLKGIIKFEVIWMAVAIMVTTTSVPPVITPGAQGRAFFFVFVK